MFNRLKTLANRPFLSYSIRQFTSSIQVGIYGQTQLHNLLPKFTVSELQAYIAEQGKERVTQELLTISNHGDLPTDHLASTPVQKYCYQLMREDSGILALDQEANFEPIFDKHQYKELFEAGKYIIKATRLTLPLSPYSPWMNPTSDLARHIHTGASYANITLGGRVSGKSASYPLRFAMLSELLAHGAGTSKAFACVGLRHLAESNKFNNIVGQVYEERRKEYFYLKLSHINYHNASVECCPWRGALYTTNESNSKLRIPQLHAVPGFESHLTYYNRNYHELRERYKPVQAGSLTSALGIFQKKMLGGMHVMDCIELNRVTRLLKKR